MSILDTWYLLFKTDKKDASKDIDDLEKQIDVLTAKGKKRSDQETQALKDLKKQHKELNDEYKEQQRHLDKIGDSFVKTIEGAATALTAYVSFAALKNGVMDAEKLNNVLKIQQGITGQSAGTMRAYGAAVAAAGGDQNAFFASVDATFKKAAQAGVPLRDIDKYYHDINQQIQGLSKNEQVRRLGLLDITDPGMISLLEKTPEEFEKIIQKQKEHAEYTQKGADAAREFDQQWNNTKQTMTDVFSIIGNDILPALTGMLKGVQSIGEFLRDHEHVAEGFFTALSVSAIAATASVARLAAAVLGLGGSGIAGTLGILARLGPIGLIAGAGVALTWGAGAAGEAIGHWINRRRGVEPQAGSPAIPRNQSTVGFNDMQKESYNFWIAQGYSPAVAAGIVANEKRESGFNPGAVGDSGLARGSFQWHPDRQRSILAGTGIDVTTASHMDQLRAAAWELNNSSLGARLRGVNSPQEAAALFSQGFERPANGTWEAQARAGMAAQIAQQMLGSAGIVPGNVTTGAGGNKSISIKIDDVNIHSNATDANGVARDISIELENQIRTTISNFDDGVQA